MNKTALATAKILIINIKLFCDEKEKEYSRVRISQNTIRRVSGLERIRDSFICDLEDACRKLGWLFFEYTDTEYGIIKLDRIKTWAKISSSRVNYLISEMDEGNYDAVDEEYETFFENSEDLSLED